MLELALILASLGDPTGPILPQYPATREWGGHPVSTVTLAPAEDHAYDLIVKNTLTIYLDETFEGIVELDGVQVRFLYTHGPGEDLDFIEVFPPPGFYAEPKGLILYEGQIGVIEIHEMVLG